ncbi:MAG: CRISPR-associated protein Cas4, partial [Candidatus Caldarchaeum sp.]|nr:CRISPR-associated protein Cas4 [Candidatus Caldarchaeum sp.]
ILYHEKPVNGGLFYEKMKRMGEELRKGEGFSRFPEVFDCLWDSAALAYSSALDRVLSISRYLSWDGVVYRVVPWTCEFPVDGRPFGLDGAIRVDALIPPSVIVEFKTRRPSRVYEVVLAGYVLCFEAMFRVPVNHALLLYLSFEESGRLGFMKTLCRSTIL